MSLLICPTCENSSLTWVDPIDTIDLLDNGIMKCDDPKCGAEFKGITGFLKAWNEKLEQKSKKGREWIAKNTTN